MTLYYQRRSVEFDIVLEITTSERTRNMARANLGLLQVNNDIRHIIMGNLDLRSIQNLETGLHKRPRLPGRQTKAIAMYRFRVSLIRYFPDPSEFARIMLQTGTIIGGSTALSIIAGGTWAPGDLDLIVTRRYLPRLEDYLKQQGYKFDPDVSQQQSEYVGNDEEERPYRFEYYCFTKGDLKIDISQCFCTKDDAMTPANFVLTYHMTFVMNFISGEGAYSFFPDETFSGRGYRNLFTVTKKLDRVLTKYADRGYKEVIDEETGRPVYLQDRFPNHEAARFKVQSVKNIWSMKLPLLSKRTHSA
ncbi:hypothetical protein BS47DRAFT_61936 [Hydnum rufescens UP504]|uniref:Uncharacterized protein n=1 Tax=Hydnum rufescens UP504 TaxID=1448309 RepID=A0A9P6AR55_9AGAM|nr:hypothetical protein BS47DRAFT_61936 [Hydnum rufescens UP504]